MKVYRYENEKGYGPYWMLDYDKRPQWMHQHNDSVMHPPPRWDIKNWPWSGLPDLVFGFLSIDQMKAWFEPEAREWLKKHNFKPCSFEVDGRSIHKGHYQCAFKRDEATKKEIEI